MKKTLLLTLLLLLICVFALSGCDGAETSFNKCKHNEIIDTAVAPTCTEAGLTEGKHCSLCGEVLIKQETVVALGHTESVDAAVKSTCTDDGLTEGKHCSICDKILVAQETIPAAHSYSKIVTQPTKTDKGYTTHTCTVCGDNYIDSYTSAIGSSGLAFKVNLSGRTCTITGIGTCTDTEVYIPEKIENYEVTVIAERAFYNCTALTEIFIPETVTEIGNQVFTGCSNLSTVYYNSAYSNRNNPFLNESHITKVVFGGKTIPSYILYNCINIENVEIKDSVTSIEKFAFDDCSALTSITIPSSVTRIGQYAFCNELKNVYVIGVENWLDIHFETITARPNHYAYLHFLDDEGKEIKEIIIPDRITVVDDYIFQNAINLTSVTIHNGVTSIGEFAFCNCIGFTSIEIPDSVTNISFYAFSDCGRLESITISKGVRTIPSATFLHCVALTNVAIPSSVTKIEWNAFRFCMELQEIHFNGTTQQWLKIQKDESWDSLAGEYTVYCTNGTVSKGGKVTYK